ncbi:MAG: TadE/TadG family type IV pilus assembly protein [bacterium]
MHSASRHIFRRACIGRRRRGIETVELALALPVLLFVIFAGFEYGWAVLRTVQLDHAARVGAREASLHGSDAMSVEQRVLGALEALGIDNASITVTPADPEGASAGEAISVEVQVRYEDVQLLGLSDFMPLPSHLRGKASMVKEPET